MHILPGPRVAWVVLMIWLRSLLGVATSLLALAAASTASAARAPADILIQGGHVFTGTTSPSTIADVVIVGDRIVYVGPGGARRYQPKRIIEAKGLIVAPGFIDPHTHPETYIRSPEDGQRVNAPWVFQGVSTVFIGIDGWGAPDIAEDAKWFSANGVGTNLVPYVGFGSVRERVIGQAARVPTPTELERMKALVAKAMCQGALGLSAGLFYAPQSFAQTDEVIALAREAAIRGGIYDTHQRDESSYSIGLLASVQEALRIGREAGLPVHFAHIKALGVDLQGQSGEVIRIIEAARAAGQDVTADQYPWTASGSTLESALLPRWALDGGRPGLMARLADPATREMIRAEMLENLRRRGGPDAVLLTAAAQSWTGNTLTEASQIWSLDPVETALRIIGAARAEFDVRGEDAVDDVVEHAETRNPASPPHARSR